MSIPLVYHKQKQDQSQFDFLDQISKRWNIPLISDISFSEKMISTQGNSEDKTSATTAIDKQNYFSLRLSDEKLQLFDHSPQSPGPFEFGRRYSGQ